MRTHNVGIVLVKRGLETKPEWWSNGVLDQSLSRITPSLHHCASPDPRTSHRTAYSKSPISPIGRPTRLPNRPESGSEAAQATQRSRPKPDKESKPTSDQRLVLERLRSVPRGTCSSSSGADRFRSFRPLCRWKIRTPPHMLRTPATRSGSLHRKQDIDQLWALRSLIVTLAQSSTYNT
jgi:hypothetical protein